MSNSDIERKEIEKFNHWAFYGTDCPEPIGRMSSPDAARYAWLARAKQDGWIKCSDRLPDTARTVLIELYDQIKFGSYDSDEGKWADEIESVYLDADDNGCVRWWCEIPALPIPPKEQS